MPFGVVNGVGFIRDGCIRWGPHPQGKREVLGFFSPIGLNDVLECILKTEMYLTCESKADNISVRTVYQRNRYLFFFLIMYFVTRSKLAFRKNLLKCNSDFTK